MSANLVLCQASPTIRLGVSRCLLGERVRYDGGHKHDPYVTDVLGQYVDAWVGVCPEVECGLPIPRESMRLVGEPEAPRLVMPRSGADQTERMLAWTAGKLDELEGQELNGFIFKKDSPSSGAFRVRVYDQNGVPKREGSGLFAGAFLKRFPNLPVEEEGRLHDLPLRENFIERIFAHARWLCLLKEEPTPGGLVQFHSAAKLALMAHSPAHYQALGRLVAKGGKLPWNELADAYYAGFMEGLSKLATRGRHVNVLQHLMGYLKDDLSSEDKQELLGVFTDYRKELVPLIVPVTLLKHHLARHAVPDWVHIQTYLNPYPKELMLRNHV
ncbi:MAG: YbgA family protein [Anaerolineae bacterium]